MKYILYCNSLKYGGYTYYANPSHIIITTYCYLAYRLRRVQKSKPIKKVKDSDAIVNPLRVLHS